MTIYQGDIGKNYEVVELDLHLDVERRLEALGLFEGTTISILNKKKKGALIIKVRGTRFAIGKDIASGILVKEVSA